MTTTMTGLVRPLLLALAAFLLAPTDGRAEPLKVRVGYVVPVSNIASILFAKDGVAVHNGKNYVVEALRFQGSTPQITALATGDLDIALLGFTSLPLAIENAGMDDLRAIVGEIQDGAPGYYSNEYAVLADGPVRRVEDLKGKVLATNVIGAAVDVGMRAMLRKHGLEDKRDYTVIEAPFPTMRGFLADRKADLVPNIPPFSMHPDMLKIARPLFTQADGIGVGELGLWVARTGFIGKQRAALTDLLEDYLRATRFYTDPANQKEAAAIGAAFSKLPVAAFESWLFTKKDYYRDPAGRIDVASLQATYAVQKELGFLKTTIDAKRYVDLSVIEEAGRRLK